MMALTYCDKFDDMYVRFDTPALDKQAYSRIEILHQCRASVYCRVIEKYAAFTEPPVALKGLRKDSPDIHRSR